MFRGNLTSIQLLSQTETKWKVKHGSQQYIIIKYYSDLNIYLPIDNTIDFQSALSSSSMQNILKGLVD